MLSQKFSIILAIPLCVGSTSTLTNTGERNVKGEGIVFS